LPLRELDGPLTINNLSLPLKYYIKLAIWRILDLAGSPLTLVSSLWMKLLRNSLHTTEYSPVAEKIFMLTGILPVPDQYYQPLINPKKRLKRSLRERRNLPAIDFNDAEQLSLLAEFDYVKELAAFPIEKLKNKSYYYNNRSFEAGDSEYLYNFIRHFKPARIIEIGCGFSTLMARNAIQYNRQEDPSYTCEHICIEPYEIGWLEEMDVKVIRRKVEDVDLSTFKSLEKNDILFIDSSHIIRPQGDVLFEYLEILPALNHGVLVHVHDIFSPHDYPDNWVYQDHRLWNEQYLLEAFLSYNTKFRILGAVNYLFHMHRAQIVAKCPVLKEQEALREPGSFWMVAN